MKDVIKVFGWLIIGFGIIFSSFAIISDPTDSGAIIIYLFVLFAYYKAWIELSYWWSLALFILLLISLNPLGIIISSFALYYANEEKERKADELKNNKESSTTYKTNDEEHDYHILYPTKKDTVSKNNNTQNDDLFLYVILGVMIGLALLAMIIN